MKHNYQVNLTASFQTKAGEPSEIRQRLARLITQADFVHKDFAIEISRVEKQSLPLPVGKVEEVKAKLKPKKVKVIRRKRSDTSR